MRHPSKDPSKEVDKALERVKRVAEVQRERRMSSKHPPVRLPEDERETLETAKTMEFKARTDIPDPDELVREIKQSTRIVLPKDLVEDDDK